MIIILNDVFMRSLNNCLLTISGILALSYLILFMMSRSIHVSLYIVSLPIIIFATMWICILLHVLYLSIFDVVKLKVRITKCARFERIYYLHYFILFFTPSQVNTKHSICTVGVC